MKNQGYDINKSTVNVDVANIVKSVIDLAKSADGIRSMTVYAHGIAKLNKELTENVIRMHENLATEAIPLYENAKMEYRRCMGRSFFSKEGDLKREARASELAIDETKKVMAMVEGSIKESTKHLLEIKKELDASFNQTFAKLVEASRPGPLLGERKAAHRVGSIDDNGELGDVIIEEFVE